MARQLLEEGQPKSVGTFIMPGRHLPCDLPTRHATFCSY